MARKVHLLVTFLALAGALLGGVLSYERPPPRGDVKVRVLAEDDPSFPQQVHISVVGADQMRVQWITKGPAPATVDYGTSPGSYTNSVSGTSDSYRYIVYKSGQIHQAVIGPLRPDTVYYYRCSSNSAAEFSFKTPPAKFPINFVIVGDLGQTGWTMSTLRHISAADYDMLLLPGDLAYADTDQRLWDNFGNLVQPLASKRPWMVTQGNHEVEKFPLLHTTPFTAYRSRWRMPYEPSRSDSTLYYSFDSAGVHVIMLGSYADFDPSSAQYKWLQGDLARIDRRRTPWIVVLIHAPWYNSNSAHQGEKESADMKEYMEELLYRARVDVVFAGHVHAYERFTRVYQGEADSCGPIHITIGDGGNREGLATHWTDPQPAISVFRESSFGHGRLQVVNSTHARWSWLRNDDDQPVASDAVWLTSLSSDPACNVKYNSTRGVKTVHYM